MMGKLLPVSQTCVVLPQLRFHGSSTDRTFVRFLSSRSELGTFSRAIGSQQHQKKWLFRWIGTRVVSDSKAPPTLIVQSTGEEEEIEIQPDTTGGDGLGSAGDGGGDGGGGGGGGGGGNNNNSNEEAEGGSGESENVKKFSMSMSQKLTLGYAALVGVGGVLGYLKSGSKKSLTAGGLSALLLYYVYTVLPTRPAFASSLGFGLSAALLGVMGSRFKKSGNIFPAGVVSFVSLIMTGGYLHGILRILH